MDPTLRLSFSSRSAALNRGQLGCHSWRSAPGTKRVEAREAVEYPTKPRTDPHNLELSSRKCLSFRNPALDKDLISKQINHIALKIYIFSCILKKEYAGMLK